MKARADTETIGVLYDAAMGNVEWGVAGNHLLRLVDGATLTLTAQYSADGGVDLIDMQGVTAREVELYAGSFLPDDVWRNAAIERRILDRVVLGTDLVTENDYRHSRIYTDLCRPNTDIFHGVMVTGSMPDGGVFSLGIHRPRPSHAFKADDKQRVQDLLPHIRRAVLIRSRLGLAQAQASVTSAVLDQLSFGVIQLTANGYVTYANDAARRILNSGDGLSLGRSGLRAVLPHDDSRLQNAIRAAGRLASNPQDTPDGDFQLRIARPSGRKSYAVLVTPLGMNRTFLLPRSPASMLIVTDPEQTPRLDHRALVKLFGFTRAEARLVAELVTGRSLQASAQVLGIGFETARTHLARARAKTETSSQADLVRVVLTALLPSAKY